MKLEGIHHITAITGDAQGNVDFYAGTLGLRMVKKTVNQDDPTVYHLFYADEQGDRRLRHHLLRVPRRGPPGRAGRRHGPHDRLAGRLRRRARVLGRAPVAAGTEIEDRHDEDRLALLRPRGPAARASPQRRRRPAPDRRPSRGPQGARAPGLRRRPRLLGEPGARAGSCSSRPWPSSRSTRAGRRAARNAAGSTSSTSRRPSRAGRAPEACTTSPGAHRSTSTRPGASASAAPAPTRPR